jgi:protein-disulfide isomerase
MTAYVGKDVSWLAVPVTEKDHTRGPREAAATLVEYGDFECPVCAQAYAVVETLIAVLGDQMRFVYRHFPLAQMHPHAELAAEAAEAAGVQGKFWEMHHILFENSPALEPDDLVEYARALHLDMRRFAKELADRVHLPRVREDFKSGVRSGVNGTPSFFINDLRYDGSRDPQSMAAALLEAANAPASQD